MRLQLSFQLIRRGSFSLHALVVNQFLVGMMVEVA